MRKQDYLVHLIQSLSPNERRYFKLFGGDQAREKKYIQLFDALENKSHYDVKALCQQLNLTTNQLADEKTYLAQALLRCLRNFDDEANTVSNLHNSLVEARSLFLRGMYEYALEFTEKVWKRALELEVTYLIPEIVVMKQACLRQLARFDELKALEKEHKLAMQRHDELFEIMQLSFEVTSYEQKRGFIEKMHRLFEHPLLKKKPEEIKSMRAFIIWFNLKSRQQTMVKSDETKWLQIVKKSVKHAESNPRLYDINPLGFLYMYSDLAAAQGSTGDYEAALRTIQGLWMKIQKSPPGVAKGGFEALKLHTLHIHAHALMHLRRYNEAVELSAQAYAQSSLLPIYEKFGFTMQYALVLFQTESVNEAVDKLNELLQMKTDVRGDLQKYVRPLMIMIQFELGNYTVIPYLIKSGRAWMKRYKISSSDVEIFFSVAAALAKAPSHEQARQWLKLKEAYNQGKLREMDDVLDIRHWLHNKPRHAKFNA